MGCLYGSFCHDTNMHLPAVVFQDGIRRGRPRADTVRELINEGENSTSRIRCNICNRVFPREKSLQAHKRTHTGERPYLCDYPDCGKAVAVADSLNAKPSLSRNTIPRLEGARSHGGPKINRGPQQAWPNGWQSEVKSSSTPCVQKYWQMREQRTPAPTKAKTLSNTTIEDQEQQDPLDFLPSDEGEEEEQEEEKSGGTARRCLQEQRERLHGALALIELANNLSA
ncbi:hypothetical protein cypCar_00039532 [Cyprinus carpio]|nr:hypothetical protein cypCar_00039532 [Cyprinus carpio]